MVRILKLLIPIFLFSNFVYSQDYNLKKEIPSIVSIFASGASDGTAETLKSHYNNFQKVFPIVNPNYWDMEVSWKNKYKNGDYTLGPKYLGSTTFLVWTTDGYHMTRFAKNTLMVTTILIHPREKKKFKYYLLDVLLHTASYHAGFFSTYEILFRK